MKEPPPPLECHPAYDRHASLLRDWLNGRGEFADRDLIMLPRNPARQRFVRADELYPTPREAVHQPHVLTRRLARGRAPYVGRPFHYAWWVAADELGRCVAGETRIVYNDDPWG